MTVLIALLTLALGLGGGFYARQVWNKLLLIETALRQLRVRQDEAPKPPPPMSYAEPIDLNTLTDEQRIAFLNR